jgi:3-dehydrosphinganine reductase
LQHVYLTGGSQGLGLALACLLAGKGAHVTIVARTQRTLDDAVEKIKVRPHRIPASLPDLLAQTCCINDQQQIHSVSADLTSYEGSQKAFDTACARFQGKAPDFVFSCVGGAGHILGFFVEETEEQLRQGLQTNYESVLWTAHVRTFGASWSYLTLCRLLRKPWRRKRSRVDSSSLPPWLASSA